MTVQAPTYTQQDLFDKAADIACCSAQKTSALVDDQQSGVETCTSSWKKLFWLINVKKVFEDVTPIFRNPGVSSTASINIINNAFNITGTLLTINGVTVYSHPTAFTTYANMFSAIQGTYGVVTIEWDGLKTLTFIVPPENYYNGIDIHFEYFDNGVAKALLQFSTQFAGGQSLDSFPPTCLDDNSDIQKIMENTTKICGCSPCSNITDGQPQPNAIIIYQTTGHWYSWTAQAGGAQASQTTLFNKTLRTVNVDNSVVIPSQYTFNSGAGVITFSWSLSGGETINVYYE